MLSKMFNYNFKNKMFSILLLMLIFCGFVFADNKDVSNWKVYKNTNYKYEIKYPKDWHYENEIDYKGDKTAVNFYPPGKKKTLEYSGDIKIFYYPNPKALSIDSFFDGSQGTGNYTLNEGGESDHLIDFIKAKLFIKIKGGFESKPTNLVIPAKDKFIIISDSYSMYQNELFPKMISTFKLFDK